MLQRLSDRFFAKRKPPHKPQGVEVVGADLGDVGGLDHGVETDLAGPEIVGATSMAGVEVPLSDEGIPDGTPLYEDDIVASQDVVSDTGPMVEAPPVSKGRFARVVTIPLGGNQVVDLDLVSGATNVRNVGLLESPGEVRVKQYQHEPVPRQAWRWRGLVVQGGGGGPVQVRRAPASVAPVGRRSMVRRSRIR